MIQTIELLCPACAFEKVRDTINAGPRSDHQAIEEIEATVRRVLPQGAPATTKKCGDCGASLNETFKTTRSTEQ